jgi:hypothetical protein
MFDLFDPRPQWEKNHRKGEMAERQVRMELAMEGYAEIEKKREGADYEARRNIRGFEDKQVEAKAGGSGLTDRQKQEKKNSDNYEVRRRNPLFF